MTASNTPCLRYLLCASAAHCAQLLHAAARQGVGLHGLQPVLQWPDSPTFTEAEAQAPRPCIVWALLPQPDAAQQQLENQWRQRLSQPSSAAWQVQMLYGNAAQQAQQLRPWLQVVALDDAASPNIDAFCRECLDTHSERQLFQHLLNKS